MGTAYIRSEFQNGDAVPAMAAEAWRRGLARYDHAFGVGAQWTAGTVELPACTSSPRCFSTEPYGGAGIKFTATTNTTFADFRKDVDTAALPGDIPLASASGTDYRNSFDPDAGVPEPASVFLIGIGVAVLRFRRRTSFL
jgi:hypothetical protein